MFYLHKAKSIRRPLGSKISDSNELSLVDKEDWSGKDILRSILKCIQKLYKFFNKILIAYLDSLEFSLVPVLELLGLLEFSTTVFEVQFIWMPLSMDGRLINFWPLLPLVLDDRSDNNGLGEEVRNLLFSWSRSMLRNFLLNSFLQIYSK